MHPILQNQYAGLTRALFQIWAELGVEVEVGTKTMAEFIEAWHEAQGFDLWLGRWIADYDDPDNFTFTLLNSRNGRLRSYFSSPEADAILEEARAEARPAARESLYRKFEHLLVDSAALVPLFHDVDYRIGGPGGARPPAPQHRSVRQLRRGRQGRERRRSSRARGRQAGGGILQVPIAGIVRSLDPSLSGTVEQAEVFPQIFETLTFAVDGTRIVPWLASSFSIENDGTRFRFKLRPGVRFHDGRRLTARDVRYSFERLLANPQSDCRWQLSAIRGAPAVAGGHGHRSGRFPHRLADGALHRPRAAGVVSSRRWSPTSGAGSFPRGRRRSARAGATTPWERGPSGSSASSRAAGSSSSATRTTGATVIPEARASSSGSALRPKRSARTSRRGGSPSRSTCCRRTSSVCGTTRGSPPATAKGRSSRPISSSSTPIAGRCGTRSCGAPSSKPWTFPVSCGERSGGSRSPRTA